ncbi:hypothetical protein HKJ32_01300 [Xylella fastidiosa subsp. multiplex]|nr:hypothetical protein [Xylella fastidiosa subsp. multiplex]QPC04524.1 hypothetical protein IUD25_01015 [Xylella fastidiosa subsp. fastidiosa]MBS9447600.1 hypothetical protein [Xylella fastidiosa subsp. multiplex]MBS9449738.1 hypothetical protein [Xylella fastidiosa subsp. multiplex]MBS9451540.1 hypothetical protein [Xylella fastidiosa subsp. multiplex]
MCALIWVVVETFTRGWFRCEASLVMLESAVLFPYFCFLAFVSGVAVLTLFALNETAISSELWSMHQHMKGYFTALLAMEELPDFGSFWKLIC